MTIITVMKNTIHPLIVPAPEEIEKRIAACRAELKALLRLLRMSRAARTAHDARALREAQPSTGEPNE
jgi:hypothetical protein